MFSSESSVTMDEELGRQLKVARQLHLDDLEAAEGGQHQGEAVLLGCGRHGNLGLDCGDVGIECFTGEVQAVCISQIFPVNEER